MQYTRRSFLKKAGAVGGGATLTAAAAEPAAAYEYQLGSVAHTTVNLNVRDGPGTGYSIIDTEPDGMRGTVKDGPVDANGYRWWYVEFDDDRYDGTATGWVADGGTWLQSGKQWSAATFMQYDAIHATDYVNIRDGPSTSNSDIGTTAPGDWGYVVDGPVQSDGYTWWNVNFYTNTNGWIAEGSGWFGEGMLNGCEAAWDTSDNRWALAKVIMSEASVGNTDERTAVGYTVLNRMKRNGTDYVTDVWDAYAHNQDPTSEIYDLATQILRCQVADNSNGTTHFYSPRSMPKEGESTYGCACGGGLEWTPGLSQRNYCPSWSETMARGYVEGARQAYYKFYRQWGNDYVY